MGFLDLFTGDDKEIKDEDLFVTLFDNEKEEVNKGSFSSLDFSDEEEDEDDYYYEDDEWNEEIN